MLRHEKREPPSGSEHTCMHTAHGSRPNVEHHTFCMRTAQNYTISENYMLETTILTSTNTTGTLTRDDLDQPGTTYSTYPVRTEVKNQRRGSTKLILSSVGVVANRFGLPTPAHASTAPKILRCAQQLRRATPSPLRDASAGARGCMAIKKNNKNND